MTRRNMKLTASGLWTLPLALSLVITGCGRTTETTTSTETQPAVEQSSEQAMDEVSLSAAEETSADEAFSLTRDNLTINETITDDADESHAIAADGTQETYSNVEVIKTGEADGDEADFYGTNAAVFATNGGTLDLSDLIVTSNGTHANAVFSYGEGSTVNISHSLIETTGNCSGGIMVTGGGTLNATDLYIHTTGNSSAAIRSDRGGGTENVTGGTYITDGTGSPVIYSTADVTVSDATLTSTASQGVVVRERTPSPSTTWI